MCILIAFFGVYIIVIATSEGGTSVDKEISIWPLILLILVPILLSVGNITQRYIRELHYLTSGAYVTLSGAVVFGLIILI